MSLSHRTDPKVPFLSTVSLMFLPVCLMSAHVSESDQAHKAMTLKPGIYPGKSLNLHTAEELLRTQKESLEDAWHGRCRPGT